MRSSRTTRLIEHHDRAERVAAALRSLATDPDPRVRSAAVEGLGREWLHGTGTAARQVDEVLRHALRDEAEEVRVAGASAYVTLRRGRRLELSSTSERALTACVRGDPSPAVRARAARALAAKGALSPPAVKALVEALRQPQEEPRLRANAADGLAAARRVPRSAVPLLLEMLDDDALGPAARRALDSLGSYGAKRLRLAIRRLLERARRELRSPADDIDALFDGSSRVSGVLETLGPHGAELVPELLQRDDGAGFRMRSALSAMGAPGVDALRRVLRSDDGRMRVRAAEELGGLFGQARAALPELLASTKDPDPELRCAGARALVLVSRGCGRWGR